MSVSAESLAVWVWAPPHPGQQRMLAHAAAMLSNCRLTIGERNDSWLWVGTASIDLDESELERVRRFLPAVSVEDLRDVGVPGVKAVGGSLSTEQGRK